MVYQTENAKVQQQRIPTRTIPIWNEFNVPVGWVYTPNFTVLVHT